MARYGTLPVAIPENTKVEIEGRTLRVSGPNGTIERRLPRELEIKQENGEISITRKNDVKQTLALQGTFRSHLANMVEGVTAGWAKELELVGAGYRAETRGKDLVLTVGYSHPVVIAAPEGITFEVNKNIVKVSGNSKDLVGHTAARIRAVRPPEPYKGKGIKYTDEIIRRKAGKQATKGD